MVSKVQKVLVVFCKFETCFLLLIITLIKLSILTKIVIKKFAWIFHIIVISKVKITKKATMMTLFHALEFSLEKPFSISSKTSSDKQADE